MGKVKKIFSLQEVFTAKSYMYLHVAEISCYLVYVLSRSIPGKKIGIQDWSENVEYVTRIFWFNSNRNRQQECIGYVGEVPAQLNKPILRENKAQHIF